MAKGKRKSTPRFECEAPPCIHVVADERRKIFRVFIEDEESIVPVDSKVLAEACEALQRVRELGYREAKDDVNEDYLARKYLDARPVE